MIRFMYIWALLISMQAMSQNLLDPTKPPSRGVVTDSAAASTPDEVAESGGIPDARVSAIFVSETTRYAIINDDMVAEGEKWNNILLSRVNRDSVELSNGQNKKVVKMFDVDVIEESQYVY